MKNKNIGLKVSVIILSILVVALGGYVVYDKVLSDNNKQEDNTDIENNNNQEEQYSFIDFSSRVFNSKAGQSQYYLILWDDGKYMYTNDNHTEETLGIYTIENDKIKLTSLYSIDRGENERSSEDDFVAIYTTKKQELKIVSLNQILDESANVELHSVNQPANEGGQNFDTILDSLTD